MAAITKEEQRRRQQRFARQVTGLVVAVLVIIGIISIFNSGLKVVERLTDQSDEMAQYESLLRSLVMYDPAPFETVDDADPDTMHAAAIWGCIYDALDKNGNLDGYVHDAETDCAILPALDVDAYLTKLVGPDYIISHESFSDSFGLMYNYSEDLQGYLIPVTSMEENYTPKVVSLKMDHGVRVVTVGYLRNTANTDLTSVTSTEPQKYMEYVFERTTSRNWYLTSLRDSDMKVSEAVATQTAEPEYDLNYNPTQAVQEAVNADETIDISNSAASDEADSAAEGDGTEDADTEDAPAEDTAEGE